MKKILYLAVAMLPIFLSAQGGNIDMADRITTVVDSSDADNLVLIQSFEVEASVDKVWNAYTTKEGWKKWVAPVAEIDFKIGGLIQTNYNKEAKIGDEGTIRLHIINYVPRKLLTLQAEISESFPVFMKEDAKGFYNVISFEKINDYTTKITSFGIGYKKNPKYLELLNFFIKGNEASYIQLISYLEKGETIKF